MSWIGKSVKIYFLLFNGKWLLFFVMQYRCSFSYCIENINLRLFNEYCYSILLLKLGLDVQAFKIEFEVKDALSCFIKLLHCWPKTSFISKRQCWQERSQECSATNRCQPTKLCLHVVTGTLHWLASLYCLLYFLAFDWLRPAVLFSLIWTVCLFVKESPISNYPD